MIRSTCHAVLVVCALAANSAVSAAVVDGELLDRATREPVKFLVLLEDRADLDPLLLPAGKIDRGRAVFADLTAVAARSQETVTARLEALGVEYRAFWIINAVAAEGDARVLQAMAGIPGVARVVEDARGSMAEPMRRGEPQGTEPQSAAPTKIEWGLHMIRAPEVWEEGVTGEGVVVGGIDTGSDWEHPAVKRQYRGFDGETVSHDYNWFDGVPETDVGCPGNSPVPCDDDGHGTHILGTMVGDDGEGNRIGVAPGARWIGCRAWEPNRRTHTSYLLACLQFMLAPTDLAGENPRPDLAPHVVNNSWICEPDEGCADVNVLRDAFDNLRAAGVMQVGGAGNNGPSCYSSKFPPSIYESYFSVGATDANDIIARFSSRGPVTSDGSGRMKPDVSAPGVQVRSAIPGGNYASWDGTSMAGPHVAGSVALLIASDPSLAGDIDRIEDVLEQSAVRKTRDIQRCGEELGSDIPNFAYGWGRIDVMAAYQAVQGVPVLPDAAPGVSALLALGPNVPNPVRTATRIPFSLGRAGPVRMTVYDVSGRRVRILLDDPAHPEGDHAVGWDGRDHAGRRVTSGIYLVRLRSVAASVARRIVVTN